MIGILLLVLLLQAATLYLLLSKKHVEDLRVNVARLMARPRPDLEEIPKETGGDQTTIYLVDKHGGLRHEVSTLLKVLPEVYEYGGEIYRRQHKLASGAHVFRAS